MAGFNNKYDDIEASLPGRYIKWIKADRQTDRQSIRMYAYNVPPEGDRSISPNHLEGLLFELVHVAKRP